jgi:FAD-dependent urate hydroxylase
VADREVTIIGAGPYGLAAAAHLRSADTQVFGAPMSFWRNHMPAGMLLRSPREASNISAPAGLSLDDFERERGLAPAQPLPLETFVDYGLWFQDRAAPAVDRRAVTRLERRDRDGDFRLTLTDGESLVSRSIVVATGISPFAWRPPEFAELPSELVSHSVDHADLSRFRDRSILVVGAGQSAVESAALLKEVGADVRLVVRGNHINWLTRSGWLHKAKPLRRMLYAPSDVGPAGVSWLIAWPGAFRHIPRGVQDSLAQRSIRPAASAWLVQRVAGVDVAFASKIKAAHIDDAGVVVEREGGPQLRADHVLLATGYRVDIAKYDFLSSELLNDVVRVAGYPRLRRGFESSVPGLFFLGAPAAWSFGPLFRFVAGTRYAAASLASVVNANRRRSRRKMGAPHREAAGSEAKA